MSKLLAVAAATLLLCGQALAATTYTDRASFNAAGTGTAFFSDLEGGSDTFYLPFYVGPLNFSGLQGGAASYIPAGSIEAGEVGSVDGSGFIQVRLSNYTDGFIDVISGPLTVSNDAGFQMIGFDLRSYFDRWGSNNAGETVLYWTDTGESGSFTLPTTNTIGFLGLAFDAPVTSLSFRIPAMRNGHTWFGIDNLQTYASVTAVPEPTTLAMLLGGLGAVGVAARRRKPA